ncbi:MAG: tRNA (adenosine(37)-N6)-threonylcarbamoyltransferase complex dimerization subunit type 1 TsaB [Methylobacteriaceae bacterium]|nr:tRNA (adenosine(37)-N6)-threonylcarbamoyltransferase complex dimerization subunit type 1 TsaB [Methylobacteriaceae bacterium]
MRILAIDTALPACSACILDSDAEEPISSETLPMARGHAEALLPLLERVVAHADGGFASLDRIAVTVGPGSFTGIRVGLSAARAIAVARRIPVTGVSTLAALAAPLILEGDAAIVVAAIDALHGAVYVTGYGSGGRTILSPRHAPVRDAVRALGAGPLRIAGSGAPMLAIEAWSMGLKAEVVGERIAPQIAYVARLGLAANPASAPARPLYLKAADAKPQKAPAIERAGDKSEQEQASGAPP